MLLEYEGKQLGTELSGLSRQPTSRFLRNRTDRIAVNPLPVTRLGSSRLVHISSIKEVVKKKHISFGLEFFSLLSPLDRAGFPLAYRAMCSVARRCARRLGCHYRPPASETCNGRSFGRTRFEYWQQPSHF
jgi:hypothetical protein